MKTFILLSVALSSVLLFAKGIEIEDEKRGCLKGSSSTEIQVWVDSEKFKFDPSCSFSFSESFKTKKGLKCQVESGMCSSFSPKESFEVTCPGRKKESMDVACRLSKRDLQVEMKESACKKKSGSMEITITVEGEDFEFNPSCDFSFSETIHTKKGITCELKAGMCSGFTPEESLEVECDGGLKIQKKIRCPKE